MSFLGEPSEPGSRRYIVIVLTGKKGFDTAGQMQLPVWKPNEELSSHTGEGSIRANMFQVLPSEKRKTTP